MRAVTGIAYARRILRVLAREPSQGLDRVRDRVDLLTGRGRDARAAYRPTLDWRRRLHAVAGAPWPCPDADKFDGEWEELGRELAGQLPLGVGHDADRGLAEAVSCLVRHLRPERVVEAGVARGVVTRFILARLAESDSGRLWSIDLPPVKELWHLQSAAAVPESLRDRWTYLAGSSRQRLPGLLVSLGSIDLFVHDSLHTERNMRFELGLAWQRLAPGGAIVADDVQENRAFFDLVAPLPTDAWLVVQEEAKDGFFGVAMKPRTD